MPALTSSISCSQGVTILWSARNIRPRKQAPSSRRPLACLTALRTLAVTGCRCWWRYLRVLPRSNERTKKIEQAHTIVSRYRRASARRHHEASYTTRRRLFQDHRGPPSTRGELLRQDDRRDRPGIARGRRSTRKTDR